MRINRERRRKKEERRRKKEERKREKKSEKREKKRHEKKETQKSMRKRPSQTKSNQRYSEEALLVHLQAKSGYRREFFREKKNLIYDGFFFVGLFREELHFLCKFSRESVIDAMQWNGSHQKNNNNKEKCAYRSHENRKTKRCTEKKVVAAF